MMWKEAEPAVVLNTVFTLVRLSSSNLSVETWWMWYFGWSFSPSFFFRNSWTSKIDVNSSPLAICCCTATFATPFTLPVSCLPWPAMPNTLITVWLNLFAKCYMLVKWCDDLYWPEQLSLSITITAWLSWLISQRLSHGLCSHSHKDGTTFPH